MDTKEIKALNIKLLEHSGFKKLDEEGNWWLKGVLELPYHAMPDLVESIDMQQKYLYPKLMADEYFEGIELICDHLENQWLCYLNFLGDYGIYCVPSEGIYAENPAEAFALAFEKMIG